MSIIEKFKNKKIAVLYGGISGERDVSLRSGKKVHESLVSQGLDAFLVDTKEEFISELRNKKPDIACIMLHGRYGEDGSIQGLLEILGIPYTGSKVLASAVGMNKAASKKIWMSCGIPTPKFIEIDKEKDIPVQCDRVSTTFPVPLVVKPVSEGSSLGVTIIHEKDKLFGTVESTVKEFGDVFIEEYIAGVQVTVGILGTGENARALPVLELVTKSVFYDYAAKYTSGMTEFVIPARLPKPVYQRVQKTALDAYRSIGCAGFARVDMIVDSDGTPYVHDANTIPGMTDLSDLPAQAASGGISYDELVLRILESAL
ncbi:MAG: D-alanine--D-alanine ligase [Candidatus Saganbacteria bacterium]|nr:D-alanine--D-alanine ligase [Candidatus Saganbacteria bacterium]